MIRFISLWLLLFSLSQAAQRPNIIVIFCDDMGYGDATCYNPKSKSPTPNIDRLAREGMRFTDAHSPASWCVPTRYGMLTGRYPHRADMDWRRKAVIEEGRTTVGSALREQGYVIVDNFLNPQQLAVMRAEAHRLAEAGRASPRRGPTPAAAR